jgi:adenine-specific DNA-methyltransferase
VGNWPTRQVSVNSSRRDFDFYAAKDIQMARESSSGLMMWDGESAGTLMNVLRLIKQNKKVEIFEAPTGRFRELKSESEWNDLISGCSSEVRLRIQKLSAAEREVLNPVQASLL